MQILSKIAENCLKMIKKLFLNDFNCFPEKIRKKFFRPKKLQKIDEKIFFGFRDNDIGLRKN